MSHLPREFSSYLTGRGLSRSSIRNYTADLTRFIRWYEQAQARPFNPKEISQSHIDEYLHALKLEGQPENTIRRHTTTLKAFYLWINPAINIGTLASTQAVQSAVQSQKSAFNQIEQENILSGQKNPIESTPFSVYLLNNGLSKNSIRNYLADLSRFENWWKQSHDNTFSPQEVTWKDALN